MRHAFVVADYGTQELFTLCEVMLGMGIKGAMYDALSNGRDIHVNTATMFTDASYDELLARVKAKEKEAKYLRQCAKPVNFGVPGGLGAKKLRDMAEMDYGLNWTLDEAKEHRYDYLRTYPDVAEYLKHISISGTFALQMQTGMTYADLCAEFGFDHNETRPREVMRAMKKSADKYARHLGIRAERMNEVRLPSGRIRTGCMFTEAANTHFQGSASDVTKRALALLYREGFDVRMMVHDEVVVAVPLHSAAQSVEEAAKEIERLMLQAFVDVCPDIGRYATVEYEIADAWGVAKNGKGETV
jgi:DNA polymerase I-like protein with 3'-5' exonuclease and polymerase domains